jgi:DNA-3-methyladenine glycosylase
MVQSPQIVNASWLGRPSTVVAPELIGCTLVRRLPEGQLLRGQIVETEAYGPDDPACHAYRRRTQRNAVMFGPAGVVYVYLIYGLYHCLNIVTDRDQVPSAVLIRALDLETLPPEIEHCSPAKIKKVAAGPGKLCRVFQIDAHLNGQALAVDAPLWIEHRSPPWQQQLETDRQTLVQTTRIGLSQGVDLPWRWYLKGCPAVSKTAATAR